VAPGGNRFHGVKYLERVAWEEYQAMQKGLKAASIANVE